MKTANRFSSFWNPTSRMRCAAWGVSWDRCDFRHVIGLLALLSVVTVGCLSAPRAQQQAAAAQRRTFLPIAGPAAPQAVRFAAIKIGTFRTLPPFDARTFIVRRSDGECVGDFYNGWVAAPNDLIRAQTARYLTESKLFADVYDASSSVCPPLVLEGVVSELSLDYKEAQPTAVVTLRFLVLDNRASTFTVLFSAEKTGRAPFEPADKAAPAQAFGQAFTQALGALAQALGDAHLPRD